MLDLPSRPSLRTRLPALMLTRRVQFVLDLSVLSGSLFAAYLLRFEFALPGDWRERLLIQLPLVVMVQFSVLLLTGVYTLVWRYVGLPEVALFLRAAAISALPLLLLRLGVPETYKDWRIPLSVIILDTVFAFGGLLGIRMLRRALYESRERRRRGGGNGRIKPVLLVGAGRAGVLAIREIHGRGDLGIRVVGFVDDDPLKQDMVIHGARVLGTSRDLPELVRRLGVDHVVITIADARREDIRGMVEACTREGIRVRTIPGLFEILQGTVEISRLKDVHVEDLLDREPVDLAGSDVGHAYTGRTVMVTGAGGSIGSELARQVARLSPARLLLVERSENALFEVHREIADLWPDLGLEPFLADVGDEARMAPLFAACPPYAILHAAAHKHVPMMELCPGEAIKNNVLATFRLGRLAARHGCRRFVLVSTDKAVNPSSVMGATKRLAELVVQDLDRRHDTRFLAVRFGNVLGSAGSVIPIFREQIARGGPVTVTHPDMVRYFMTIPEAAQLVLEAGAMGQGGEIFVLDMGRPVRILDLARKMIRLSALEPDRDVPIVFTGLRPGEKLFEELGTDGEDLAKTRHPKIFIGKLSAAPPARIEGALAQLETLVAADDGVAVRELLADLIPEGRLEGLSARAS